LPFQIAQAQAMTRDYLAKQNKPDEFKALPETKKSESTATTGTAFLVNTQGHLLTNAHVVNQCKTINVYSENTTTLAEIVARDEKNDMAIIKTDVWSYAKPMQFSKQGVGLGQDIYAIGYPLPTLLALDLQMTKGNVSALAGLGNDSRFYQISAPVQSGNSGGPLVNGYGLVSGMVTSKANLVKVKEMTGDFPQNVNFAIKESQLKNYLDTNRIAYDTASSSDELKGEAIAERARKYTVLVECLR
jgi:S1-C subfamily serine protease